MRARLQQGQTKPHLAGIGQAQPSRASEVGGDIRKVRPRPLTRVVYKYYSELAVVSMQLNNRQLISQAR